MTDRVDLGRALLEELLEKELEEFRSTLENESPGLSNSEIERYMRAASKFAAQLLGARPRTRGRKPRSTDS
jgi:hypothetical protein